MTVLHRPATHHCAPGWTPYVITDHIDRRLNGRIGLHPPDVGTRTGTVIRCDECGRTWVAHRDPRRGHYPGNLGPSFRREGRIERWRRERRDPAAAPPVRGTGLVSHHPSVEGPDLRCVIVDDTIPIGARVTVEWRP